MFLMIKFEYGYQYLELLYVFMVQKHVYLPGLKKLVYLPIRWMQQFHVG